MWALLGAFGGEWDRTGEIDGKSGRPGGKARHMQAARPHRLDLGRVRLDRIIDHALCRALREIVGERLEDVLVDGGVLDRRVGEHQRSGIAPLLGVRGRVRHEVAVLVAIEGIKLAAVLARIALREGGGRGERAEHRTDCHRMTPPLTPH